LLVALVYLSRGVEIPQGPLNWLYSSDPCFLWDQNAWAGGS